MGKKKLFSVKADQALLDRIPFDEIAECEVDDVGYTVYLYHRLADIELLPEFVEPEPESVEEAAPAPSGLLSAQGPFESCRAAIRAITGVEEADEEKAADALVVAAEKLTGTPLGRHCEQAVEAWLNSLATPVRIEEPDVDWPLSEHEVVAIETEIGAEVKWPQERVDRDLAITWTDGLQWHTGPQPVLVPITWSDEEGETALEVADASFNAFEQWECVREESKYEAQSSGWVKFVVATEEVAEKENTVEEAQEFQYQPLAVHQMSTVQVRAELADLGIRGRTRMKVAEQRAALVAARFEQCQVSRTPEGEEVIVHPNTMPWGDAVEAELYSHLEQIHQQLRALLDKPEPVVVVEPVEEDPKAVYAAAQAGRIAAAEAGDVEQLQLADLAAKWWPVAEVADRLPTQKDLSGRTYAVLFSQVSRWELARKFPDGRVIRQVFKSFRPDVWKDWFVRLRMTDDHGNVIK